ncbi:hypothetical protein [Botrimarina mediterranea]|uniref:Uncharacterized protein n=1 Tax=Botrimarina mediterranea TaxID=2528022 RepID=A0A518K5I9_9BACT|nr:hypothetical protein [Botrimarina mediterranea]QDV73060.1 hypothetical protein Spa11_12490 [Botrimarina mediterranea]
MRYKFDNPELQRRYEAEVDRTKGMTIEEQLADLKALQEVIERRHQDIIADKPEGDGN